jgi:phosphatidylglycerophosphate synthase
MKKTVASARPQANANAAALRERTNDAHDRGDLTTFLRNPSPRPPYDPITPQVTHMRVGESTTRRPIPSRGAPWAIALARWLQRAGARPNQVSVAGVGFAALAAVCLIFAGRSGGEARAALLLAAAGAIVLRLLCNMLDGMLAVEGGLRTPSGEIFNELPDRISDPLILVGAGYAVSGVSWGPDLGWAAATMALLTAYVRTLGAAAGAAQHFEGPMAKPRRMHLVIAACILSAVAAVSGWREGWLLAVALGLVIAGGVVTMAVRLRGIVADLRASGT